MPNAIAVPVRATLILAILSVGARLAAQDGFEFPDEKKKRTSRGLDPLVIPDLPAALEAAKRRELPLLVAVGMNGEGGVPALFRDPHVARASRAVVALAAADFYSEDEFFRSRRITRDRVPCVLVLDPLGNVLDTQPADAEPTRVVAAARAVLKLAKGIADELPRVVKRAEELAAGGNVDALLEYLRPWLQRHLRGYPEIARIVELASAPGRERLERLAAATPPEALAALPKLAEDFRDTPVEAGAVLRMARLQADAGREDEAKRLLARILEEMPWPENADAHREVRAMIADYRRAEIERRRALEESEGPPRGP